MVALKKLFVVCFVCLLGCQVSLLADDAEPAGALYEKWTKGPSNDPAFFPIGVSTQQPQLAGEFKDAGINMFVRLWDGPTEAQLAELKKHGMKTICDQNELALESRSDLIIGWTLPDEPDLAKPMVHTWKNDKNRIRQAWPDLSEEVIASMDRYGPPIPPAAILEQYKTYKRLGPDRPVRLNLSMAVAYPEFKGRGTRSGHGEDYETYAKACDILSFDIYPYNEPNVDVRGKLHLQAVGLKRLSQLTGGEKPIWNYIESTKIFKNGRKPTKAVMRNQVWMSIIHGSSGIIYFAHGVHPETGEFWDKALVSDAAQMENIKQINAEIKSLARVINSPQDKGAAMVRCRERAAPELGRLGIQPVASNFHVLDGYLYVFACRMADEAADAVFILRRDIEPDSEVEVIGEDRKITMDGPAFRDNFGSYEAHLYKIKLSGGE